MTSPGGCKTSVERFARNDLVSRFFDFKRSKLKNEHSSLVAANLLKRKKNLAFSVQKFVADRRNLRHLQPVSVSSTVMALPQRILSAPPAQIEAQKAA
jgi:hypothetical protein